MKKLIVFIFLIGCATLFASNGKYRLMLRNNPATSIVIGWDQISGDTPVVYYGTKDFGTDYSKYTLSHKPDRIVTFRGMNNHFARLNNLKPNTAYFFVIKDSEGVSERFWFKTAPKNKERLSLISGGDSRNKRKSRKNANTLVAKLKPHAVLFGGDMTASDNDKQWIHWMNDWQLTIASDNRMFPIIAARGNHERENQTIHNLFDTPSDKNYYSISFGNNLLKVFTLNTEMSIAGSQTNWLKNDLSVSKKAKWRIAQYHKPMRPHVATKREGFNQYANWAKLFYEHNVQLVIECDAHTVKTTWPIKPSTGPDSDEGFVRDDKNGTVYVGEGCWGAPLRKDNDPKSWTRNSGMFNQFKWIFVSRKQIICRTIKTDSASNVTEISNENPFEIPQNLEIWMPSNGSVVKINN